MDYLLLPDPKNDSGWKVKEEPTEKNPEPEDYKDIESYFEARVKYFECSEDLPEHPGYGEKPPVNFGERIPGSWIRLQHRWLVGDNEWEDISLSEFNEYTKSVPPEHFRIVAIYDLETKGAIVSKRVSGWREDAQKRRDERDKVRQAAKDWLQENSDSGEDTFSSDDMVTAFEGGSMWRQIQTAVDVPGKVVEEKGRCLNCGARFVGDVTSVQCPSCASEPSSQEGDLEFQSGNPDVELTALKLRSQISENRNNIERWHSMVHEAAFCLSQGDTVKAREYLAQLDQEMHDIPPEHAVEIKWDATDSEMNEFSMAHAKADILREESESPYCKICESCGHDGCCSALKCHHSPDGDYCDHYLDELKFGYRMYHKLFSLLKSDDSTDVLKKKADEIFDEQYDISFPGKSTSPQ